jgi:hypothetical protein
LIGTRLLISNDPTHVTEGENIFVFTPADWVDINTLKFFEEGVRQLIIHQVYLVLDMINLINEKKKKKFFFLF